MDAYIGQGLAEGAAKVQAYNQGRDERDARVAEARNRAELSKQQLQEYNAMAPARKTEAELAQEKTKAELQKMQASLAKQQAYDAFKQYDTSKDTKFLNNLVTQWKDNPMGQSLLGDVVRVDPVTAADSAMLQQAGISDVKGYIDRNTGDIVKVTHQDGQQSILDMHQIYAGTGYTDYLDTQSLEKRAREALITSRMRQGESSTRLSAEERVVNQLMQDNPDLTWTQAYKQVIDMKNGGGLKGSTETERAAKKIQEQAAANGETIDDIEAMKRAVELTKPTSKQKDLASAEDAKAQLDSTFGDKYFDTDFTKPENRRKAEPYVRRIEELSGAEIPLAQQKRLSELRQLITLGGAGAEVTDAETGPLDAMLRDAKKYISNDIGGTAATSAYEAYRNMVRNALFGASLTNNETAAFNKAFGTLGEQTGPVLAKLRTQMKMLQDELSSIYNMNDEYVTKFRTGMDSDKLNEALFALDDRLALFDNIAPESAAEPMATAKPTEPAAAPPAEDRQAQLEELFK